MGLNKENLEKNITAMDGGKFQALASDYVRVCFGKRFKCLENWGMTSDGRTKANFPFPDAGVILNDSLDAMEASHGDDWSGHVRNDLEKLKVIRNSGISVSGYVFISWGVRDKDNANFLKTYNSLYAEFKGISRDQATFDIIFRQRLLDHLILPGYAQIVYKHLNICPSLKVFRIVQYCLKEKQFSRSHEFIPTLKEYEDGDVRPPSLLSEIKILLAEKRVCLVSGKGASGKTVLANCLAFSDERKDYPNYYLDLSGEEVTIGDVIDDLSGFCAENALWIVDNAHRNQELADYIYYEWDEKYSKQNLLLFLERKTTSADLSPPTNRRFPEKELKPSKEDLIGIVHRLAKRENIHLGVFPPESVAQWEKLFLGDLFAFSMAVKLCLGEMNQGNFNLLPEHADVATRKYLKPLKTFELDNALYASAMATLELSIHQDGCEFEIPWDPFPELERAGLIERFNSKGKLTGDYSIFMLIHPGLGRLILATHPKRISLIEIFKKIIHKFPIAVFSILVRLNQSPEADHKKCFNALFHWVFSDKALCIRLFEKVNFCRLNQFVVFVQKDMSEDRYKMMVDCLYDEESLKIWVKRGLEEEPLKDFVFFLKFVGKDRISKIIECPELDTSIYALIERALREEHFDGLTTFLRFAKKNMNAVYTKFIENLNDETTINALVERGLKKEPLNNLAGFLSIAKENMNAVYTRFIDRLNDETTINALVERGLEEKETLGSLAKFLNFCDQHEKKIFFRLIKKFSDESAIRTLADKCVNAKLQEVVSFIDVFPEKEDILGKISLEKWRSCRLEERNPAPDTFHSFYKSLRALKREDLENLLNSPADRLLKNDTFQNWNKPNVVLSQFSHVVRYADLNREKIIEILKGILTDEWLDTQIAEMTLGGLCGALFSLWKYAGEAVKDFFCDRPSMLVRLREAHWIVEKENDLKMLEAIQFLGVIMFLYPSKKVAMKPFKNSKKKLVSAIADEFSKSLTKPYFATDVKLHCLGLRSLACLSQIPVSVSSDYGAGVLNRLKSLELRTPRDDAFNKWMESWLEVCQQKNWTLVSNCTPLFANDIG